MVGSGFIMIGDDASSCPSSRAKSRHVIEESWEGRAGVLFNLCAEVRGLLIDAPTASCLSTPTYEYIVPSSRPARTEQLSGSTSPPILTPAFSFYCRLWAPSLIRGPALDLDPHQQPFCPHSLHEVDHIHGRLAASLPQSPSPSLVVNRGGRGGISVHTDILQGSPVEVGHNVPCASLYEMRPDDPNMRGARYTYTLPDADNLPLSPIESWTPDHDEMSSQPKTRFHVMSTGARSVWCRLRALLTHVFLPAGYPSSVAPEYLRYQLWHVLQDITTYLRGILATKAVLEGMGVGKGGATALGATLQWMARDGASMMSGLVFTTLVSTDFNRNIKPWRLFADFIVDVGITLEMLAPAFPRRFVLLICLASVCKTMCGIAAGSVNGVIVEHLARSSNIGDVVAKGGAQHTAVNMFGLSFGVLFAHVANVSPQRVWTAYITLTVIHLLANYRAMRALALRSLNRSRTEVLIAEFQRSAVDGVRSASTQAGLDPEAVGRREKILGPPLEVLGLTGSKIRLGVRLKELAASGAEVRRLQELFQKEPYMVNRRGSQILVALRSGATKLDQLRAYFNAVLLRENMQSETAVQTALSKTRASFPEFVAQLERQGWDLSRVLLGMEGWVFTGGAGTDTRSQAVKGVRDRAYSEDSSEMQGPNERQNHRVVLPD